MASSSARTTLAVVAAVALGATVIQTFVPILGAPGPLGQFSDETLNVAVALNCFTRLLCTFEPDKPYGGAFFPEMTTGLLSTWPSAIGWTLGGDLIGARIALIVYDLVLLLGVGYAAMRTVFRLERALALSLAALVCAAVLLVIPDAPWIVVHVQGELSGAAWLAAGYLLLPSYPRLAALVLGLCVWHTKIIYAPFALVGIARSAWTNAPSWPRRARLLLVQLLVFLVPLVGWMLLILIRIGSDGFAVWWTGHLNWFVQGHSGLSGGPFVRGLWQRLASPRLDWRDLTLATKARVLALLFVPPVVLVATVVRRRRAGERNTTDDFLRLALAGLGLVFAWWYFFWNDFMWVRHIDPMLIVGLAVLGYSAARAMERASPARRATAVAGFAGVILLEAALGVPSAVAALRSSSLATSATRYCRSDTPWSAAPWPICVRLAVGTPRPLPSPRPTVTPEASTES